MKSMHAAHRNLTGAYCVYSPILKSENAKTRTMTDAVLAALNATIIALYAAMFLGLYRWSHYAPLFAPDSATMVLPDHPDVLASSVWPFALGGW
jgi:hypothetical protein